MTTVTSFRDFYANWVGAFDRASTHSPKAIDGWWENHRAYDELAKSKFLMIVLPLKESLDHPCTSFLESIWLEVAMYARLKGDVVAQNSQFRDVLELLESFEKRCKSVQKRVRLPILDGKLKALANRFADDQAKVRSIFESHWQRTLRKYDRVGPTRQRSFLSIDQEAGLVEEEIEPGPAVQALERIHANWNVETKLIRDADLDGRFQRRLGRVIRHYLPGGNGISLRTVSRLVVLVHICACLVAEAELSPRRSRSSRGGNIKRLALVITESKRELSVDLIDQKLRAAGLR